MKFTTSSLIFYFILTSTLVSSTPFRRSLSRLSERDTTGLEHDLVERDFGSCDSAELFERDFELEVNERDTAGFELDLFEQDTTGLEYDLFERDTTGFESDLFERDISAYDSSDLFERGVSNDLAERARGAGGVADFTFAIANLAQRLKNEPKVSLPILHLLFFVSMCTEYVRSSHQALGRIR